MSDTPHLTIPLTLEEVQKRVKCPDDGGVAIRGELIIPTDRHELFKQLLVAMQREQQLRLLTAENRDALMAGLPYLEGATFSSQYARDQVRRQIEACQMALDVNHDARNDYRGSD